MGNIFTSTSGNSNIIQNIKIQYFQNIVAGVDFNHKQINFLFLKNIKIYIKIHINIAPKHFSLQPSSGSLH